MAPAQGRHATRCGSSMVHKSRSVPRSRQGFLIFRVGSLEWGSEGSRYPCSLFVPFLFRVVWELDLKVVSCVLFWNGDMDYSSLDDVPHCVRMNLQQQHNQQHQIMSPAFSIVTDSSPQQTHRRVEKTGPSFQVLWKHGSVSVLWTWKWGRPTVSQR